MVVRDTAWHYRMLYSNGFEHTRNVQLNTNLCAYFWRCVLGSLKFLSTIALIIMAIAFVCFFIYLIFTNAGVQLGLVIAAFVIGATIGTVKGTEVLMEKHEETPNIFFLYLKARKEKVCPVLTVEEGK